MAAGPNAQAVGPEAPDTALAGGNTADGQLALGGLTTGLYNSAFGIYSLLSNGAANFNTGVGAGTLLANTADENTATGAGALFSNTTGASNTATGAFALFSHISGNGNTAYGWHALLSDATGQLNTAVGSAALATENNGFNGSFNTAVGAGALFSNTGGDNTAIGAGALQDNVDGSDNTGVGLNALLNNSSGSNNVALGRNAGISQTTGSNDIYIGTLVDGVAGENDSCYIGSIFNQLSSRGTAVFINANNKLGTMTSSKRFKKEIKPMDKASNVLFSLNPVTFRYKRRLTRQAYRSSGSWLKRWKRSIPTSCYATKKEKPIACATTR